MARLARRRRRRARGRWPGLVRRYGVVEAAKRYRSNAAPNPARRRRRRRRRNPSGFIRVGGSWRPMTRYFTRGRRGKLRRFRRPRGYRRVAGYRVISRRPRRVRRIYRPAANPGNPYVGPYTYRRKRRRVRVPRYYRRARRNPGYSYRRRMRVRNNPVAAIMERIEETFSAEGIGDMLQGLTGFGGALAGGKLLTSQIPGLQTPVGRVASTFASGLLLSALSGYVIPDAPKKIFVGSLIATGWQLLSEVVPAEKKADFPVPLLAGMGATAEEAAFEKAVESEILKQMRGGQTAGVGEMGETYWVQPAGVEEYIPPAGAEGVGAYITAREAEQAGMGAYMTAMEAETAGMGVYDEFAGASSPERF